MHSIVPKNSMPGVPQNNAVAERMNREIIDGVRTILVRAGLPACFWTTACWHYCLARTVWPNEDGDSSWSLTHEKAWEWPLIPFGAAVIRVPGVAP